MQKHQWRISPTVLFQILFILGVVFATMGASAKDLANRLGVGYKNQFSSELPGIAVQYYPSADLGLSATLGVDTQKNNSKFGFMVRAYRIIFPEENMNFYMGAGAGLISSETTVGASSSNDSGFDLSGFTGGEFFLPGLDNLSMNFEVGVAITSVSSTGVRFRTFGDSPLRAGMTFYF